MDFIVIQGDISRQRADALVSAVDTSLAMSGGAARALKDVGGDELGAAASAAGPVALGEVVVTDAFDLSAECVAHAAAKPVAGAATAESVRSATEAVLSTLADEGCRSVVLPAIGCGVGGLALEEGGRVIAEVISSFDSPTLTDIRLIAYTSSDKQRLQAIADKVTRQRSNEHSVTGSRNESV
jgi:O-acetyl-ADP-ribose deacetylase (regulator of RNase III)